MINIFDLFDGSYTLESKKGDLFTCYYKNGLDVIVDVANNVFTDWKIKTNSITYTQSFRVGNNKDELTISKASLYLFDSDSMSHIYVLKKATKLELSLDIDIKPKEIIVKDESIVVDSVDYLSDKLDTDSFSQDISDILNIDLDSDDFDF